MSAFNGGNHNKKMEKCNKCGNELKQIEGKVKIGVQMEKLKLQKDGFIVKEKTTMSGWKCKRCSSISQRRI